MFWIAVSAARVLTQLIFRLGVCLSSFQVPDRRSGCPSLWYCAGTWVCSLGWCGRGYVQLQTTFQLHPWKLPWQWKIPTMNWDVSPINFLGDFSSYKLAISVFPGAKNKPIPSNSGEKIFRTPENEDEPKMQMDKLWRDEPNLETHGLRKPST